MNRMINNVHYENEEGEINSAKEGWEGSLMEIHKADLEK